VKNRFTAKNAFEDTITKEVIVLSDTPGNIIEIKE